MSICEFQNTLKTVFIEKNYNGIFYLRVYVIQEIFREQMTFRGGRRMNSLTVLIEGSVLRTLVNSLWLWVLNFNHTVWVLLYVLSFHLKIISICGQNCKNKNSTKNTFTYDLLETFSSICFIICSQSCSLSLSNKINIWNI